MSECTILMVAGEASADAHAAQVIRALRALMPHCRFVGMGGPRMQEAGMECAWGMDELSVMGFTDVARRIRHIYRVFAGIKELMGTQRPSLFIPVDLPDFNMRLCRHARDLGIRVLYYIAPQAWAWRRSRARTLARITDGLAVIFPFEEAFFRASGVNARYVGHPFMEDAGQIPGSMSSWPPRRIAMLPGSRRHEISRILPVMMDAKRRIALTHPGLDWVLPVARGIDPAAVRVLTDPDVRLADSLPEVDLAMVKSGTSSLEVAIRGAPGVICYKTSLVNYLLARIFVKIHHIGMPNIIAGSTVMPELIQADLTGESLAQTMLAYLEDRGRFETARQACTGLRHVLGPKKASTEVARWARELLEAA
ncbi:MAG TPA: lipid-A-disaccharide synthase [Deltaproteobacteria bacterium]|nr:lipid-A-disaccharide synthase [Deltaproteobacteria bacterium]